MWWQIKIIDSEILFLCMPLTFLRLKLLLAVAFPLSNLFSTWQIALSFLQRLFNVFFYSWDRVHQFFQWVGSKPVSPLMSFTWRICLLDFFGGVQYSWSIFQTVFRSRGTRKMVNIGVDLTIKIFTYCQHWKIFVLIFNALRFTWVLDIAFSLQKSITIKQISVSW